MPFAQVIIEKSEYDRLRQIEEEKSDILVRVDIALYRGSYHVTPVFYSTHEAVKDKQKITVMTSAIEVAAGMIRKDSEDMIFERDQQLAYIRGRWWYRLFFSWNKWEKWRTEKRIKPK